MKNLLTPLLLLFFFSNVFSQPNSCATEMPEEMMSWLKEYKMNSNGPYINKAEDEITYLPIKVHIAGNDLGGGHYKMSTLLDALYTLNTQYLPYNWQFYIYGNINYINSDVLNQHTSGYQTIINNQAAPDLINIFFVANPSGACGYFTGYGGAQGSGSGRQGYVAINNSCAANKNSTIAHELGHYFSLPHTFYGWENRGVTAAPKSTDERVNGSNCSTTGDYFCDTPADFISDRWNCPYSLTKTDYVGTPYNPDGTLFMSYSNDACQNHHSPEQLDAMRSYLPDRRGYLLNYTFPNYAYIIDTAHTIFPANGAMNVPANYVNLKWDLVPGATHYLLEATRSNNPNILAIDTIVTDTSLLFTNLDAGYTYRWRVRAFNNYSTGSPFTLYSTFSTSTATTLNPVINVDPVSCSGAFDGGILVNINGGQGPYNYQWSDGSSTSQLTYLDEGTYLVTVTDGSNQRIVLSIDISEPAPLDVNLALGGSTLVAQITGGTPPYTYAWSTGETGVTTTANTTGNYSVTITDANGCTANKTFGYVGISQVDAASSLRVYPNPTAGATSFAIEFTVPQAITATIEVLDNTGRSVYSAPQSFSTGLNVTNVPVAQLSSGIYFVRIVSQEVVKTTKLMVY
ncbi:hypothetical protein BH09BAC1_BH09BAC1_20080 [soil metagenome]